MYGCLNQLVYIVIVLEQRAGCSLVLIAYLHDNECRCLGMYKMFLFNITHDLPLSSFEDSPNGSN